VDRYIRAIYSLSHYIKRAGIAIVEDQKKFLEEALNRINSRVIFHSIGRIKIK